MTFGEARNDGAPRSRRKLRPLIITMGGARQESMEQLFASMPDDFEPPAFSPGIPSRSLRNRFEFLRVAHEVGLVPDAEWQAIEAAQSNQVYQKHPNQFWDCLKDIPVTPGRRGSEHDIKLHYSVELWQKAKGVNRGGATMACLLAHLRAMNCCVEEDYDFILEDNVRAPPEECAQRIWETIGASEEWQRADGEQCHLRYFGWLGSLPNLHWVLNTHIPRTAFTHERTDDDTEEESSQANVFPFPITQDFDLSPEDSEALVEEEHVLTASQQHPTFGHQKPGGTPIWGAYAYWISKQGLESLLEALRSDVGAMLWKGKRMRAYSVKPIDKVLPRQLMESLGRLCIHVSTRPAFFRAPMLTSKIHSQWDAEFCKSSQYQMEHCVLSWSDLWLSDMERRIVHHHSKTGDWLTMDELAELESEAGDQ